MAVPISWRVTRISSPRPCRPSAFNDQVRSDSDSRRAVRRWRPALLLSRAQQSSLFSEIDPAYELSYLESSNLISTRSAHVYAVSEKDRPTHITTVEIVRTGQHASSTSTVPT